VNLDVTVSAIGVLRVLIVLWASGLVSPNAMRRAVASKAELRHPASYQQARISRTMRRMAGSAPFGLHRSVLIHKRSLFISVAFNASCICPSSQSCLFKLKAAVRVVTIHTAHSAFKDFVMKRHVELVLNFAVASQAKLRIT